MLLVVFIPEQLFSHSYYTVSDNSETSLIVNSDFTSLADKTSPAVVDILTQSQYNPFLSDPFFQTFFSHSLQTENFSSSVQSSGSGVIIHKNGFILTCAHVVDKADEIYVKLNTGEKFEAKKLVVYPQIDIALVQLISEKKLDLPFLKLATKFPLKNGSPVAALGNGFNLGQSFTNGIISASRRNLRMRDSDNFSRVLQHTAVVNPGNSGGALVDKYGDLIGINNAIYSRGDVHSGVGFAIPSDIIRKYLDKYALKYPDVVTGVEDVKNYLNSSKDNPQDLPQRGVLLEEISSDSSLAKAGVRSGDILYQINNDPISDIIEWEQFEDTINPMKAYDFKILRGNQLLSFTVHFSVVSHFSSSKEFKISQPPFDKCSFVPVLKGSKQARKFKKFTNGVRVICVKTKDDQLPSSFMGILSLNGNGSLLKNDDIIISVNGVAIENQETFESAVKRGMLKNEMNIVLIRNNTTMNLSLRGLPNEAKSDKILPGVFGSEGDV